MHLWNTYGIPGTILTSINGSPHLLFMISLWSEFYSPHFTLLKDDCVNYTKCQVLYCKMEISQFDEIQNHYLL